MLILYIFHATDKHKRIYNQQNANTKHRRHSYMFQLLSLAIFRG